MTPGGDSSLLSAVGPMNSVQRSRAVRKRVLSRFDAGGSPCGHIPSSASGDYSDVSVSSPYLVIPWPKVSGLNDEEMKLLMDVVDRALPTASYTRCSRRVPAGRVLSLLAILSRSVTNLRFARTNAETEVIAP